MDDAELKQRLDAIEKKLDETYRAARATRNYLMWTAIVTAVFFILPLVGLMFAIPSFISTYAQIGAL